MDRPFVRASRRGAPTDALRFAGMCPAAPVPPRAAAWAAAQFRRKALQLALEKLEIANIEALPVKGILLAHQVYEDPVDRPMVDVDLLVSWRNFPNVLRVARAAGWRTFWDSRILGSANLVVHGVPIDVAASVGPPGTSAVGVSAFLERATTRVEPLGFPHLQIEWHDHTLLMAIDAFKDKLACKPWSREDLVRLAEAPSFDPVKLVALARAARLETMLSLVADWVLSEPSQPWMDVRRRLSGNGLRHRYAKAFASRAARTATKRTSVVLALLARTVSDHPAQRASALALGAVGTTVHSVRTFLGRRARHG